MAGPFGLATFTFVQFPRYTLDLKSSRESLAYLVNVNTRTAHTCSESVPSWIKVSKRSNLVFSGFIHISFP